ncbi:YHYH protein [Pseudooceanicola aestuarii]|uniref:YHYH protein n=1 Tax=Pseudooceanicola aestuarii TaxID=2697319 RepID=UPI0013D6474F|nr:YHYH protein [Pseudooceanicola aestuarii]
MTRSPAPWLVALSLLPMTAHAHPDPARFNATAFASEPAIVDCTLEDGSTAQCYEFTVPYKPAELEIGPFCPSDIDGEGGLWDWDGEEAGLYKLDRAFWEMLAAQGYKFYDEDGTIAISDPGSGARPTADHSCLMATQDESVIITMRLPVTPVMAEDATGLGTVAQVGVALDGVPIFADAPSVLETGHLPALDVCGGHIDPGGWYHWHATATDIDTIAEHEGVAVDCGAVAQDPTAIFGYAFDGFPMMGSLEADGTKPEGLDQCNGHVGATAQGETYHYHASPEFPNLPTCLVGLTAQDKFATTAQNGIGAAGFGGAGPNGAPGQGGGLPEGMDDAAKTLGVTLPALLDALGTGPRPDFDAAAQTLGVSVEALRAALPARP